MRNLFITLIVLTFISCNQNSETKTAETSTDSVSAETRKQKTIVPPDTIITTPCAIMIEPTSEQIDSLKGGNEEDFYTIADDNAFYMSGVTKLLDSTKTTTIYREAIGKIIFKLPNDKTIDINLSEFYWGALLFNGKTEPIKADITDIGTEYTRYMKK
jgi:hypothetical protein